MRKRGRKAKAEDPKLKELERENARLKRRLARVETMLEIPKKASELLGIPSCPKTQTNSRLARRDVSDQRRLRLGWPMEARILGHEEAEPALDLVGRRHRWLDPA